MIRNITELKRVAKAQGVKMPAKATASTFNALSDTYGVFMAGEDVLHEYHLNPSERTGKHPLRKNKRGTVRLGSTLSIQPMRKIETVADYLNTL